MDRQNLSEQDRARLKAIDAHMRRLDVARYVRQWERKRRRLRIIGWSFIALALVLACVLMCACGGDGLNPVAPSNPPTKVQPPPATPPCCVLEPGDATINM